MQFSRRTIGPLGEGYSERATTLGGALNFSSGEALVSKPPSG